MSRKFIVSICSEEGFLEWLRWKIKMQLIFGKLYNLTLSDMYGGYIKMQAFNLIHSSSDSICRLIEGTFPVSKMVHNILDYWEKFIVFSSVGTLFFKDIYRS
jgi:hypothetical protein